jgi:DNA ligase (NAD+)
MDRLRNAAPEDVAAVPGIGSAVAGSLRNFFADSVNRDLVRKLEEAGLQMVGEVEEGDMPLAGKKFVLTGSLDTVTREEATERILALGGTVTSSVSSKTDYVIVGSSPGSKLAKAKELGTPLLTEPEFVRMVDPQ